MADPATLIAGLSVVGGLFAGSKLSKPKATPQAAAAQPAAAPSAPAVAPSAGGRQSFLSSAAAVPQQQNIGSKTLLGQ